METKKLVPELLSGNRLALSRLISCVENRTPDLIEVMREIQEHCGKAYTIGITGPPGAGKSTTVDKIIRDFRGRGKTVAVVAIDPSSPFSGGAVLGDRIRMQDWAGDDGVFIRSLGSRGKQGGVSRATREVVKLYDAFGFDVVIVETVGVGQTELDIMEIAETTVVLVTPESGDSIQTMKAGILEIADIFVVNKADRDGSYKMQSELSTMVEIGGHSSSGWVTPVLMTQAEKNVGIRELVEAMENHRRFLAQLSPELAPKKKAAFHDEVKDIVLEAFGRQIEGVLEKDKTDGPKKNPYQMAQELLKKISFH